ncbi:hypothetical protein OH76DRAFT_1456309 [Lentinus brumalis]|uniref:CxC2-like cysteine cluster KDZ transposase-associated domain-containing protein n=1 Tax=Lentinus brumalis TaxID=2498619 RepID=A0A371D6Z8_9APHY|nr:hypothetical protein OH76DRAFT_1456309 [Polyporus brumalis]
MQRFDENWQVIIPTLVEAYMQWRYGTPAAEDPEVLPSADVIEIDVLDLYGTSRKVSINRCAERSLIEDLALTGYLGTAPLHPSFAISFKTLEMFRCMRLFKASWSVEAFTRLLCYQYYVPYRRFFRTAISDAFDIYLTIRREVKKQVMGALGRDAPGWRVKNGCPACSCQVEGEEPPKHERILVMDGNNSLKRVATSGGRQAGDTRVYEDGDYFLSRDFVDSFAGEVKSRQSPHKPELLDPVDASERDAEDEPEEGATTEGDPTDGTANTAAPSACASNWKAAAADDKKRMWAIYDETGIFASACRHGLILWIADMVRSGELAKYGLATVAKTMQEVGGKNMWGYDIGCEFLITVNNSSLGPAFTESDSQFCVNAFHGYSHSYNCQVQFHPNRIPGMGLEDLETMERIFSRSNQLASVTRYASPYRRRALIAAYFEHWDHEKYSNLGHMLFSNYKQALGIIEEKTPILHEALQVLSLSEDDLRRFEQEERTYFTTLRDESSEDLRDILYVEALQELWAASEELKDTSARYYDHVARAGDAADAAADASTPRALTFLTPRNGPTTYEADLSATRKLETRRRYLRERVDQLSADVIAIEVRLGIDQRWTPMDARYKDAVKYIAERTYQRALGKLQRLVVQRLFELHKLNIAQTGYKARTYIAKNLQRRCKAIRTAVTAYNNAARALDPPRPTLDWSKASQYSFVEEFTLLEDTRNDLREKQWAQPAVRETIRTWQRLERAHEEITNVNRELRRVHTAIRDEELLFTAVLQDLKAKGTPLYGAVNEYCLHRRGANARNMVYLQATYALPGFSGDPTPGTRVGGTLPALVPPSRLQDLLGEETDVVRAEMAEEAALDDDDEVSEEVSALIEYVAGLAL